MRCSPARLALVALCLVTLGCSDARGSDAGAADAALADASAGDAGALDAGAADAGAADAGSGTDASFAPDGGPPSDAAPPEPDACAIEICNGVDDDCDSMIDDGVLLDLFVDADGDGFGDAASPTTGCAPASGLVADSSDCDDANLAIHPGSSEICNDVDDDCDGGADDGLPVVTYYRDADDDGYAASTSGAISSCAAPAGYTARMPTGAATRDCTDADARAFPGQTMFFASPIAGAPALTRYDFDCNGANVVRYTSGAACTGSPVDCNASVSLPAFAGSGVTCGGSGTLVTACGSVFVGGVLSCGATATPGTPQLCR